MFVHIDCRGKHLVSLEKNSLILQDLLASGKCQYNVSPYWIASIWYASYSSWHLPLCLQQQGEGRMASCLCPCFLLIGIISCGLFFPASQSSVCLVMGVLVIPSELGHNKLKHMLSKTWKMETCWSTANTNELCKGIWMCRSLSYLIWGRVSLGNLGAIEYSIVFTSNLKRNLYP